MKRENGKTAPWLRWLAAALCALMLAGILPVSAMAQEAEEPTLPPIIAGEDYELYLQGAAPEQTPEEEQEEQETQEEESAFVVWINKAIDWVFDNVSILGFMMDPRKGLAYNTKDPFQRIFGFNIVYEALQPVAGVFCDTLHIKFNYDNRDWMLQLWKGAYLYSACTGGEIGLYNKPETRKAEHYDCAREADWIGMEMTIYNKERHLFTRTYDQGWWLTGYRFSYLQGFIDKPREKCLMQAKLVLDDDEMAGLVAEQLDEIGFTKTESLALHDTPDSYTIQGNVITLVWVNLTESMI